MESTHFPVEEFKCDELFNLLGVYNVLAWHFENTSISASQGVILDVLPDNLSKLKFIELMMNFVEIHLLSWGGISFVNAVVVGFNLIHRLNLLNVVWVLHAEQLSEHLSESW